MSDGPLYEGASSSLISWKIRKMSSLTELCVFEEEVLEADVLRELEVDVDGEFKAVEVVTFLEDQKDKMDMLG